MTKSIAIIGAGASGITCIKEVLEAGFKPVCYEKGGYTGGLWRYHDSDEDGIASVMKSTIINSSKEMSAYSDFPPPPQLPNYCHNSLMIKYLDSYAEKHQVGKYVHFYHEVITIQMADDFEKTGRWNVKVRDNKSGEIHENTFDGVMVATGHHVKPLIPTFKGQDKFKGRIVHTHSYKKPQGYEDLNVLVVGIGNSGGDAAVELSMVGKKCYLSTRRGVWMLWRVGPNGEPFDSTYLTRFWDYLFKLTPYSLVNSVVEYSLNSRFDHEKYGLKPNHRVFAQHPMVNDALPNRILSGTVVIKGDIEEFVEDGVIFKGESHVTPIDAVILATGYEVHFPFLDDKILWTKNNEVQLYKYMFNPNLTHPHTLAFIGLIQAVGPAIPVSEMQARWYIHLMQGKSRLPAPVTMMKDIKKKRDEIARRYFTGPRHTMQIDWIPFLDELASQFGAKPNVWKYMFTDPRLFYHLLLGPCAPYQWRLSGPGAWKGARDALLSIQDRIDAAFQTKAPNGSAESVKCIDTHANGNSECSKMMHVKSSSSSSTYNSLILLLMTFLKFFPLFVKGAKYSLMVACGLFFLHNTLHLLRGA